MSRDVKEQGRKNRLQTLEEWFKFVRNGAIVGLVAALLFFWNSRHTAEEISVAIALPLIIFNCIPVVLAGIANIFSRHFRKPVQQEPLPFPDKPTVNIKDLPLKHRLLGYAVVGTLVVMLICFLAGIAIFLASIAYPYFGVSRAALPARHLAYLVLAISVLPIVVLASFAAGLYCSGRFRDSAIFRWISSKAARPLDYWPNPA